MKKLSSLMLALLAVTLFTACGNDDEPTNKQTFTAPINSRAIDGDQVVFYQGSSKVEVDYTNMFIHFTADYKDSNGHTHNLTTSDMKLVSSIGTVYSFNNAASSASSGFDNFNGYIDFATGMMWYSFHDDNSLVVTTSQLLYAYATTTITNPDNGNHISHEQSAYLFALDSKGETCIMKVNNFIPNISGTVQAAEVQYADLTVTPTPTGYTITADEVESSYRGFYTITDLRFDITAQGHILNGTFKCGDLDFTVTGQLFPLQTELQD